MTQSRGYATAELRQNVRQLTNSRVALAPLALISLPLCAATHADPPNNSSMAPEKGLTVQGHSEIDVNADVAHVTFDVTMGAPQSADAVTADAARTER